jgi:hypothetical protein
MSFKLTTPLLAALALAAGCSTTGTSAADLPGRHPFYVHALSDLNAARWNLEHRPGDAVVSGQEDIAITEIDRAIAEARKAASWDGKDLVDRPRDDVARDHAGRMHRALELLRQAHTDVHEQEDNPETRELRNRIDLHIVEAIHANERAIRDVELGR